jgi:hypothetical protein
LIRRDRWQASRHLGACRLIVAYGASLCELLMHGIVESHRFSPVKVTVQRLQTFYRKMFSAA